MSAGLPADRNEQCQGDCYFRGSRHATCEGMACRLDELARQAYAKAAARATAPAVGGASRVRDERPTELHKLCAKSPDVCYMAEHDSSPCFGVCALLSVGVPDADVARASLVALGRAMRLGRVRKAR